MDDQINPTEQFSLDVDNSERHAGTAGGDHDLHGTRLSVESKDRGLIRFWRDASNYFLSKYCELASLELYEGWMEYEDYLDEETQPNGKFR